MLQPFLFIGVGGSGGDTLRHLYRDLDQRVRRAGWSRMPAGWQFLHIDSRATEEHSDDLPPLPRGSYYGLAGRNVSYQTIARYMNRQPNRVRSACVGWRPDPELVHVAIEEGAGQFRAIGRAVTVARLADVNAKLREAVERVEHGRSQADLADLNFAMTGESSGGRAPNPVVIVFSSLAGGTGSGTFMDVCDLLRGLDRTWTNNSVAVLYAPDVFDSLKDDLRRGVQANALATVSELLAGHWLADPGPDPVHEEAGAVFRDMRRSGPAYSFLVGTTNGRLTFTDQQDVFSVVARTIAAWATSAAIQKQFSSYVQSNWQQGADRADPLELIPTPVDMPFSSLGYANVSLGRDLFGRYAAQCLARATAERLLYGPSGAQVDDTVASADIDAVVRRRRKEFTEAILGVAGESTRTLYHKFSAGRALVLQASRDNVHEATPGDRSIGEWGRLLIATIAEEQRTFLAARRKDVQQRSELWLRTIKDVVHGELRRSVAADGLVVTRKLVHATIEFLKKEETPGLSGEALQDGEFGRAFPNEIATALGAEPGGLLRRKRLFPATHERVTNAVERGVEAGCGRAWDAEVRRLCAQLLGDFADNLLRPLLVELDRAISTLRQDAVSPGDGKPSLISRWPQGPAYAVPLDLRPGLTQFVVDYFEDYPAKFTELLGRAVNATEAGVTDAVAQAIRQILIDDWEYQGATVHLVEQPSSWQPEAVRDWTNLERVAQSAAFTLNVSADQLLRRCEAWLAQASGFGSYLRQTLAEALGGAQPTLDQQQRLTRYASQFEQAIEASSPLIRLDAGYLDLHMDGDTAVQPLISPIPLEPGSVAYQVTTDLLLEHTGLAEEKIAGQFNAGGSSEIEFTSFLNVPCHPIAFTSLTRPIQSDWQEKRGHANRRAAFSRWRRARPLPRAVPLPRVVRQQMVRGWLVAFAAGELSITDEGQYLEVQTPLDPPHRFPLLGSRPRTDDAFDTLAAVLESLPLLLIEQTIEDSPAIAAYAYLLGLDEMGQLLKDEAVRDKLETLARDAEGRLPMLPPPGADRVWDLREDILDALTVLKGRLRELS
ncbi:tubulin-like doman-containing protein [Actinocrispum sp. NPDC049592]|uniref:tubulin-like doman-containing protein n=1 Tax=Actinocrispum sp. NPDC049592 TaxID=3154835 RepID=UPI003434A1D0